MKNKILKRTSCYFILLSFLFVSLVTGFASEPTIVIEPSVEFPGSVGLGRSISLEYVQHGTINIPSDIQETPKEKDVLFVLDTSFTMDGTPGLAGLLEHTLFSRSHANFSGSNTTIIGDTFVRDRINTNTTLTIDGKVETSEITGSISPLPSFTDSKYTQLTDDPNSDNFKGKHDEIFPDEESYGFKELQHVFDRIITNADNNSSIETKNFASYYPRDTRELYTLYGSPNNDPFGGVFSNPNHGYFRNFDARAVTNPGNRIQILMDPDASNQLSVFYVPVVTNNSPLEFGLGDFTVSDDPLVIKSDMYFDGNVTISVKSITKDITNGHAGFILATGDITLQGHNTTIDTDLFLISMNGNITIESGNNDFRGIALAPNGTVTTKGDSNNYSGSYIGKDLNITSNSTFSGPDGIGGGIPPSYFPDVAYIDGATQAIYDFIDQLGSYTKPGAIVYSSKAARINPSEGANLVTEIDQFIANKGEVLESNLGDALRLASYEFNNPDREKYIIVFTGKEPNAYSSTSSTGNTFLIDNGPAVYVNPNETLPNEALAKEYVQRVISERLSDVNIIFVDISTDSSMGDYFSSLIRPEDDKITLSEFRTIPLVLKRLTEDEADSEDTLYSLDFKNANFKATLPNLKITSVKVINEANEEFTISDLSSIRDVLNPDAVTIPVFSYIKFNEDSTENPREYSLSKIKVVITASVISDKLVFTPTEIYGKTEATAKVSSDAYIKYDFHILKNGLFDDEFTHTEDFVDVTIKVLHDIDVT